MNCGITLRSGAGINQLAYVSGADWCGETKFLIGIKYYVTQRVT